MLRGRGIHGLMPVRRQSRKNSRRMRHKPNRGLWRPLTMQGVTYEERDPIGRDYRGSVAVRPTDSDDVQGGRPPLELAAMAFA